MNMEGLRPAIARLIDKAGLSGDFNLHPLAGGTNNRVFRVEVSGRYALLKVYFQHPQDHRDRLSAEYAFTGFAWENGLRCLPQPLACDHDNQFGLYECVMGRQLLPHEITKEVVGEALNFFTELNRYQQHAGAGALPTASEACFTIAGHLECVQQRLDNLMNIDTSSEINREAFNFISNNLLKSWAETAASLRKQALELCILDAEITPKDRCLSPSDFGFHNAILARDGRLRFIDFEYAGWDDPAKMVCDFFCQPAVPVPPQYFNFFVDGVILQQVNPQSLLRRISLLMPVYRLKWCCIILNDFLPVGNERRNYALNASGQETRKRNQLIKAHACLTNFALNTIMSTSHQAKEL